MAIPQFLQQYPTLNELEKILEHTVYDEHAETIALVPQMFEALQELIAEFEYDSRKAAMEPGCFGLNETNGIKWARDIIKKVEG